MSASKQQPEHPDAARQQIRHPAELLCLAGLMLLTACGGGGSSSTPPSSDDDVTDISVEVGEVFSGRIVNGAPVIVAVDMVADQLYRVEMDPAESTTEAAYDTMIVNIIDPRGNSLGISDDDSGPGFASTLVFTATETATYSVVAGVPSPNSLGGTFTLLVSELIVPEDDFSDALDDSKVIGVWERLDAFIEQPGDIDTIAVSLEAGTAVDITVYGNDNGLYGELRGAEIRAFVDADGVDIDSELFDKVKGFGNFIVEVEQITYTPPTTGLYFLTVGSNSGVGDYSVAVGEQDKGIYGIRAHEPFVFTGIPEIDAFYDPQSVDFFKNDHIVSDRDDDGIATLTYSLLSANSRFSESFHHPIASAPTVDFEPASGIVLDTFMSVMESISGFANIEFVEVPDDGVQAGNFRMGFSGLLVGGPGFLANGWSGFARWAEFGETWINPTQTALNIQGTTIELDNFLVNRTLHEFSHNLGLAHPDRSPNFASDIDPALSGQEYSVMSRTSSGTFPGAFGDLWPQTLMWFDIQAIQAAYGVAGDATGGDNTYTVDTERRHFSTIWDMAGNDTLVLTGNADTSVDLTPGTWQDVGTTITYFRSGGVVGTRTETIFIAPDTIIENVVAGSGNDKITGNSADNHLDGGAGRDVLIGGPGDDVLKGGSGADTFQFLSTADGNNVIRDFSTDDDVINLDHPLDALGTDAGARGVVLSEDSRGNTLLNIDINGDGAADRPEFSITLQDVVRADFVAAMTLDRKIILYK